MEVKSALHQLYPDDASNIEEFLGIKEHGSRMWLDRVDKTRHSTIKIKYCQKYCEVEVFDNCVVVELKRNRGNQWRFTNHANGKIYKGFVNDLGECDKVDNSKEYITKEQAVEIAWKWTNFSTSMNKTSKVIGPIIYGVGKNVRVIYDVRFSVSSESFEEPRFGVDSKTGERVFQYNDHQSAFARRRLVSGQGGNLIKRWTYDNSTKALPYMDIPSIRMANASMTMMTSWFLTCPGGRIAILLKHWLRNALLNP